MSEALQHTHERPEDKGKFTPERNTRQFLGMLKAQAIELSRRRFPTLEEAKLYGAEFMATTNSISETIEGLERVRVRAEGGDLLISNVNFENDPDTGIIVEIDTQDPFIAPGPFFEQEGFYYGVPLQFDEDTDGHYATPYLILQNTYTSDVPSKDDMPVAKMYLSYYMKMPLAGDVNITTPALEAYENRMRTLSKVALRSVEQPHAEVIASLKALLDEFDTASDKDFVLFQGIDNFHRLARVTEEEADIESVIDALRQIIGQERSLHVQAAAYEGVDATELEGYEVISGRVVDVLAFHEKLRITEPMLVVESTPSSPDAENEQTLYYIPLSQIKALKF